MKTWFKRSLVVVMAIIMVLGIVACGTPTIDTPPGELPPITIPDDLVTPIPDEGTEEIPNDTNPVPPDTIPDMEKDPDPGAFNYNDVPAYSGSPFWMANNGMPYFTAAEMQNTETFETYSELDSLGRCGVAYANIHKTLMPNEDRESLSSVSPSGWNNKKYDTDLVDGGWIYNRAHLIGFQLAGEQANEKNLITGTRYCNVEGMLPFENMIADYIKETNNHVLYRVTPIYVGDELVARGVLMEAYSVEDEGDGVCYNVFCYNVQPGIEIDYATGNSWLSNEKPVKNPEVNDQEKGEKTTYVLNTNSKKFHYPDCSSVGKMSEKNKEERTTTREDLIADGYEPCGSCKP